MTAPTMEQRYQKLVSSIEYMRGTRYDLHGIAQVPAKFGDHMDAHNALGLMWDLQELARDLLARFAELERERDEAREGWHMANGVADLAMKHRNRAEALLRKLHPYVDSLICYASTLDEHEGNRIAKDVNDYFADDTIFDAAIAQRAGETG